MSGGPSATTYTYEGVISPDGNKKRLLGSFTGTDLILNPPGSRITGAKPAAANMSSSGESDAGSFVFDNGDPNLEQEITTPRTSTVLDEPGSYDLKPPPPTVPHSNVEKLAAALFSVEHLNLILRDHALAHSFAVFLETYRPRLYPVLMRYQEAQKAIAALHYANESAESAFGDMLEIDPRPAVLGTEFDKEYERVNGELVSDGLTAFITYKLVQTVTECLVKEITGNQVPLLRGLMEGIAEVYCLTDPNLPDNPIVYASEGGNPVLISWCCMVERNSWSTPVN